MSNEARGTRGAGHPHPNYMAIFWWLLALTIVEVAIGVLQVGPGAVRLAKVSSLILLAMAKATLVAMYFMHLRFEKRTLALIAGTPIVLCAFMMLMLVPDALRSLHNRAVVNSTAAAPAEPR